jgi:hypothetical protein
MKRFTTLLFAGAAIVAAQTAPQQQSQESEDYVAQLQQKLQAAINDTKEQAELAKNEAIALHELLIGKTAEEGKLILELNRVQTQERLLLAIEALEQVSAEVRTQVEEVHVRILDRLQEKKDELIRSREQIRAREQTREENNLDYDLEK